MRMPKLQINHQDEDTQSLSLQTEIQNLSSVSSCMLVGIVDTLPTPFCKSFDLGSPFLFSAIIIIIIIITLFQEDNIFGMNASLT